MAENRNKTETVDSRARKAIVEARAKELFAALDVSNVARVIELADGETTRCVVAHDTAILHAARSCSIECVEALLPYGDPLVEGFANTALHVAAAGGRADVVQLLLPHSESNARNEARQTPLMLAARAGAAEVVKILLPRCDAMARNEDEATALHIAADGGWVECVELLLPAMDPNAQDWRGFTPLMQAAAPDWPPTAPRAQSSPGGVDPRAACVKALLAVSDVSTKSHAHQTALMLAADDGNADAVALLLARSDAKAVDHEGNTALHFAARSLCLPCIELLLPVSDPTARNCYGDTPAKTATRVPNIVGHSELTRRREVCVEFFARCAAQREAVELAAAARVGATRGRRTCGRGASRRPKDASFSNHSERARAGPHWQNERRISIGARPSRVGHEALNGVFSH